MSKAGGKKKIVNILIWALVVGLLLILLWQGLTLYACYKNKNQFREDGITAYKQGEYTQAIVLLERSLDEKVSFTEPVDRDSRFYLADAYFKLEQYDQAVVQYDILLQSEVEDIDYLNIQKGICASIAYYRQENYQAALEGFVHAIEAGHAELCPYVVVCYEKLDDIKNAETYLLSYLDYNSNSSYAYSELATININRGDYNEAIKYIRSGLEIEDTEYRQQLLLEQVVYYEYMHNYNKAFELIDSYMQLYPEDAAGQREYDFLYTTKTD